MHLHLAETFLIEHLNWKQILRPSSLGLARNGPNLTIFFNILLQFFQAFGLHEGWNSGLVLSQDLFEFAHLK